MTHQKESTGLISLGLLGLLFTAGCSSDDDAGTGSAAILVEAEDVIIEGLEPGEGAENIRDGWSVGFEKYIVALGDIDLHLATDETLEKKAEGGYLVDLTQVPASGLDGLWQFEGMKEGRWEFNYSTIGAADGAVQHETVEDADFDAMVENDWTYWIEGVLQKADGQSCPPATLAQPGDKTPNGNTSGSDACYDAPTVSFAFGAEAETVYGPCEIGGVPGFAVTADSTATVTITLHGDHLFFNGFPEGDEGGVTRLAQWLADSDLDLDGTVTQEELEAIDPAQLAELDDRYQLGGSPITPLETMYDYVRSQLKTQGHYQGEGECAVDGVAHEHGHDHDHGDEEHDHGDEEHDHGDEEHDHEH